MICCFVVLSLSNKTKKKMKRVIQRALPLDVKYTIENISYLSIEDGGGCSCDNCGKLITNTATVKSDKGTYTIGLDCLESVILNNELIDSNEYIEYLYSDKPAIGKAKSLRSKILREFKKDQNYKAKLVELKDGGFGFSFESLKNGRFEPKGWDYTFNPKFKELTINYVKGLDCVILK